ncbi:MAG TPA: tol-pal system protein YbgF [Thermoanaerobaculia bacterium]|nr:tol-pal system protein YbgF [Thermoanaerobaculia bacterium]
MKILRPFALVAATLAATGCVSTSDFEAAQHQIAELQDELANVKRTAAGKEDVQNVNTKIAEQTETLLKSNATLVAKVAEIDDRIQNSQGSIEQTNYRIDQLAQQMTQAQRDMEEMRARIAALAVPAPPTTTAPATSTGGAASGEMTVQPPVTPTADPIETYQAAFRDYQKGNFDLAIEGFRDFLQASPNTDLSDNASYWIGESLFSQKKYRDAIREFDSVVTKFPKSDKVPGALLKKGYAYISLGEKAQGVVQLQYVIHEHPKSQEAALARQKLNQLGIETK